MSFMWDKQIDCFQKVKSSINQELVQGDRQAAIPGGFIFLIVRSAKTPFTDEYEKKGTHFIHWSLNWKWMSPVPKLLQN